MTTKIFIGIPSYNRARILRFSLNSFMRSKLINGFILVIDASQNSEKDLYAKVIKELIDHGFEVIYDINIGRRGSAKARNSVLNIAENNLNARDILLIYEDDHVYAGDMSIIPAIHWLRDSQIGIIGGKVINLWKRSIDPDFAININNLADALTRISGFIFLDIKHGPRFVDYTTHLMATKVEVLNKRVRYDENYAGIGYREESDFQRQVKELGYKMIFEPRFYAYHLAIESGGDRYSDLEDRMFWKWRNHTYFMKKWRYPIYKQIFGYAILSIYAILSGPLAVKGITKASKVMT